MNDRANSLLRRMSMALPAGPIGQRRRLPALALNFAERRLLMLLGDLFALYVALGVTLALRPGFAFSLTPLWEYLIWFVVLTGVWLTMSSVMSLYDFGNVANGLRSLRVTSGTVVLACALYFFIPFVSPPLPPSRIHLLILPLAGIASITAWRIIYHKALLQPTFHRQALVIGTGPVAQFLLRTIAQLGPSAAPGPNLGYQIVGLVDDAPQRRTERVNGLPVLGGYGDLLHLLDEHRPDEIVVAISHENELDEQLLQAILAAQESGIRITTMTVLFEQLTGRLALDQIGQRFDLVLPLRRSAGHRLYVIMRRLAELLISLAGCAVLALVIPFVWVANRFWSPGPLFFRQERVGLRGKSFYLVKFRSMVVDAERQTGAVWATENDPRITAVGQFLRKTRLDELPQFWNILKGEMSLIGPRPERPPFVAQLAETMPFYRVRHAVRPGLTGWAQVKYRYASSVDDSLIKLQYDLYYIKHRGPYLDLLILLTTAQIVLGLKGR